MAPLADGPSFRRDAPEDSPHFIYVVECADGSLYTGYTVDVEQRVACHNAGKGARYTASRRPVSLVASAAFATKHLALSAEFRFKRLSRARKLELIAEARAGASFARLVEEHVLAPPEDAKE